MARLALAMVVVAATAHADPDPHTQAKQLFDQARQLVKAGKPDDACVLFEKSFALDPETGTQLNVADCAERHGDLVRAWQLFDAGATASEHAGNQLRAKFARRRLDALAVRLATVVIHVAEPAQTGLALTVAGASIVPGAQLEQHVMPGEIAIDASAPDRVPFHAKVTASAGAKVDVNVTLAPVAKPEPPPLDTATPPAPAAPAAPVVTPSPPATEHLAVHEHRASSRGTLVWILGGAGAASGVAGLGVAIYAKHDYTQALAANDFPRANHDVHLADVGTVFGAASAAMIAAAAIVYITAPRQTIALRPTASPTAVGLAIDGRF